MQGEHEDRGVLHRDKKTDRDKTNSWTETKQQRDQDKQNSNGCFFCLGPAVFFFVSVSFFCHALGYPPRSGSLGNKSTPPTKWPKCGDCFGLRQMTWVSPT